MSAKPITVLSYAFEVTISGGIRYKVENKKFHFYVKQNRVNPRMLLLGLRDPSAFLVFQFYSGRKPRVERNGRCEG